ncbi:hypothetical protein XA68_13315 [Ophiocordyceps unilateralis]|uniref:Sulfhydryl oxidase n=1 Tax=Ophiocordyceps unilateralis TaxID=268505 RepID=A0A2A9PCS4_OPHUN|nr:hypothetical protein XA68_13315 [Ophiocordyceps unilateralis]
MARRTHITLMLLLGLAFLFSISYLYSGPGSLTARDAARLLNKVRSRPPQAPLSNTDAGSKGDAESGFKPGLPDALLDGDSIAPKLENATLKAELGRATWKFLHTMVAKYPEKPTPEDRQTLQFFFVYFGKLYPCGDCARHFRGLLKKMPPQTSSRNSAAGWLCEVHNQVNKRLEKPIFDCNNIGDFYDCGCAEDKKNDKKKEKKDKLTRFILPTPIHARWFDTDELAKPNIEAVQRSRDANNGQRIATRDYGRHQWGQLGAAARVL